MKRVKEEIDTESFPADSNSSLSETTFVDEGRVQEGNINSALKIPNLIFQLSLLKLHILFIYVVLI